MKRTDLDKLEGLRLRPQVAGTGSAFGKNPPPQPSRREQRELDRAAGLVPFAVKLNDALVARLHALAKDHPDGMNAVVAELLGKGLEAEVGSNPGTSPASKPAAKAEKPAEAKVTEAKAAPVKPAKAKPEPAKKPAAKAAKGK